MNPSFNLIDRPWIPVQRPDGTTEETSLMGLFEHATGYARLLGDVPTQVPPILRLALAVLHRAVDGPADLEAWRDLWGTQRLPHARIAAYLDAHRNRFELLHPETPFYQVADLRTKKTEIGLAAFIADIPTGEPKYAMRAAEGLQRIDFAEAARWVVHCQAFDLSGIKGAAEGDPRGKGGKSYPIGPGSLGRVGAVYPEGTASLAETLLLNLIPDEFLEDNAGEIDPEDVPVWEREPHGSAPEMRQPEGAPKGLLDLYTWQSRRLRLRFDEDGVTGALICQGDRLELRNQWASEPMTAWRRSRNQERQLKTEPVYLPRRHDPSKNVWRGLAAALPATTGSLADKSDSLAPLVLRWIGTAQAEDALDRDRRIKYHVTGIVYGTQEAVIDDLIDDSLTMAAAAFDAEHPELARTITNAAGDAEAAVTALSYFAKDLARAAGDRDNAAGAGTAASDIAYAALDTEYRDWLSHLTADTDTDLARSDWQRRVRKTVVDLGERLLASSGPAAWKGRADGDRQINSPIAANAFRRRIAKALPLAFPARPDEEETD